MAESLVQLRVQVLLVAERVLNPDQVCMEMGFGAKGSLETVCAWDGNVEAGKSMY